MGRKSSKSALILLTIALFLIPYLPVVNGGIIAGG